MSPPSWLRRRWHYLLLLAVALGIATFLGHWFYQGYLHEEELRRVLAETQEREPNGWRLAELEANRRTVADADNSALTLAAAKALRPKDWPYWYRTGIPNDPERDPEVLQEIMRVLDEQWPPNRRLPDHVFRALRNEMCRGQECLDRARPVIDQPFGRGQIVYKPGGIMTALPNVDQTNLFLTMFLYEAQKRAEEGDYDRAIESCRCGIQCGRAIGDEPCGVSQSCRMKASADTALCLQRILAQGEPSPETLAACQRLLEEEEREPLLAIGARGERALMESMMGALEQRQLTYGQVRQLMTTSGAKLYGVEDWTYWAAAGDPNRNRASFLRLGNRFVAIAELPIERRQSAMREFETEIKAEPRFVNGIYRGVQRGHQACNRSTILMRCGIVLIALERFRQEQGKWPENLAELTPGYLVQVPLDPIDGQSLRYRRWEQGVMIYSVGGDGVDDGGKLPETRSPPQLTHYQAKDRDCGLRLYDVRQRRLP